MENKSIIRKSITRIGIGLFLLLCATHSIAEPVLNGLAVSVELNKERFIAGLYTSNPSSDASDLLANTGERRMELKVTARRFSARSLNNMWIEGMAINNPSSALRAESENLSKMVNMIRKSLTAGDTLIFDTEPGAGTRITLNGVQLGTIESEDFFSLLLRTWIGNVPLSSEFKTDLLAGGSYDQNLRDRYAVIEPTAARIAAVEELSSPSTAAPTQVAAAPTITPPRPTRVQITPPRPTIQPPAPATIEAISRQDPVEVAESLPATRPSPNNESANADEPENAEEEESTPAQVAPVGPSTPARTTNNARPLSPPPAEEEEEEEEEEQAVFTAETLLERQLYISDVLRQAQRLVRYPDRALRREQEGTVLVSATLDRTGRLLGTLTVEESRYSILNKEAEESIERASPYKEFPDSMTDQTYSFTIPVTFKISR